MNPAETTTIQYVKKDGSYTERDVIAVSVPADQIKAIDVSNVNGDGCRQLEELVERYNTFKDAKFKKFVEKLPNFEDWLDIKGITLSQDVGSLKWRTFKLDGIGEEWRTDLDNDK